MGNRHYAPPSKELQSYMDAVWDFMVEHCDLTERGAFFVKFHASGRADFEKRIRARWKHGYHRIDDRTGFDIRTKEADAAARRKAHEDTKAVKHRRHVLSHERQKEAFAKLEQERREAAERERLANMPPLSRVINSLPMRALALQWYTRIELWIKSKSKNNRNSSSVQSAPLLPKQKQG